MTITEKRLLTNKWALVVDHYEKIKTKNNPSFKTVTELCEAFQVTRRDIKNYYGRWASTGKGSRSSLTT